MNKKNGKKKKLRVFWGSSGLITYRYSIDSVYVLWCEKIIKRCASGVMVIVVGIGHGDTSSNPGLIVFHIALIPLGKVWIQLFSLQLWVNSRADWFLQPWWGN